MTPSAWSDPAARLALLDRVGASEFARRLAEHMHKRPRRKPGRPIDSGTDRSHAISQPKDTTP